MHLNSCSLARTLLLAGSFAAMVLAATPSRAQDDLPPGSARLAFLEGSVSIQPNGLDGWGQAYPNMPVGPGDRVATGEPGRGELQAGPVRAYFNSHADLTMINLNPQGVELGVAQGSAIVVSDGFSNGGLSVQTPNGAVTIAGRAGFRIDAFPEQQSTIITNNPNSSGLTLNGGGGFYLHLDPGQSVQLVGTNPVMAQPLEPAPYDDFAHWGGALESHRLNSASARYVNVEMPGYDQLDSTGDWQAQSDYGPIWFPRVEAGWAPYHYGHWVNIPFYGYSWVADEPWGAAPFHYGRWVQLQGRWGWIPGPREGHPIWSPAQVVFAGGIQFGGGGVAVWFPLGPGEAYRPWYPASPTYINQINITNIHESTVIHVQTTYITNVTNVTYVNRSVGVTAMKQEDFAAGRSTREAAPVKIDPKQMEHVQPLAKIPVQPPAHPVILHPAAKPAAVAAARPVLINSKGQMAVASPNAKPVPPPVKPIPEAKPIPGHAPTGKPIVAGKPVETPAKPEPAKPDAAKPPTPAAKTPPAPAKPEAKPATKPADTKPATKDDKKKDDKKKPEDKKPE